MKPIIYERGNRTFKMYVGPDSIHGMACAYLYELRPNRKIFKWRMCDSYHFWVDDFDTIEEGCRNRLARFLKEEADRIAIAKKWSEFNAKY